MQLVSLLCTAIGCECLSCGTVLCMFTDTQSCSSGQLTDRTALRGCSWVHQCLSISTEAVQGVSGGICLTSEKLSFG